MESTSCGTYIEPTAPAPNSYFAGRAGLLQQLCSGFGLEQRRESGHSAGDLSPATGCGWVGKTQLALAFAHLH
jgi:hypothetical protein